MGGMNNPEQNRKLLKDEDNLKRKNLLESTSAYNFGSYALDRGIAAYSIAEEKNRVAKLKVSDENKHQYISCLAGKEGGIVAAAGLAGGGYKELKDLNYKLNDNEQINAYGGRLGVIKDSGKDMKNNLIGLSYGLINNNPDCESLLKKKIW